MSQEIKNNIARIEQELADMKERLAKEEAAAKRPWPAKICQGMKFKREGRIYQVCMNQNSSSSFVLVRMDMDVYYGANGNTWANEGFGGKDNEAEFEYIPEAKTLVFATGEALVGKMCMVSNGDTDGTYGSRSKVIEYSPFGKGYRIENGSCWYRFAIPLDALS